MRNTLIKASAGTGKTFALATRMIRLMLLGTAPQQMVALTFSRAAAGEIFSRIAERLAAAAADAEGASREAAHVFDGLDPALAQTLRAAHPEGLAAGVFAGLLRNLIATQHISMIGTIDSFMTRMVQAFPLELGLQGGLAMMDDYRASREKNAAAAALLNATSGTGEAALFCEAFRLATMGREGKSFCEKLEGFIDDWHTAYLDHPNASAWGDPAAIWPGGRAPFAVHATPQSLAARLRDTLRADWEAAGRAAAWDEFCDFVAAFNGTFGGIKSGVKNVLAAYTPDGDITITYNRKSKTFTAAEARLIREAVETILGIALNMRCDHTQGIHHLMAQIENVYSAATRRHGKLVFGDIPRLIARLDFATRQNIEYRFDTRFRHWALDEFQDTSHAQWNVIRNLVEEVIQSTDERSMFIVGDMKQAIYGWRGGDVAIFGQEADSGLYEQLALNNSYRYAPEIASCVNRVFDGARVAAFLADSAAGAGAAWQRLWGEHRSAVTRPGFVSVTRVSAPDKEEGERDIAPYLNAACAELGRVRPWERGISTAVLIRSNKHGVPFAEALRAAHIPAVWEGESAISDTPVVTALLNLLRFAEHPGDTLAWQHVRATPLAARVFADIFALPAPKAQRALSTRVLGDVSRHGLPRALRGYIETMGETDAFTQGRLDALLRVAVQFTAEADAESTLTDFADYVNRFTTRDVADTSTVKILTVHRSKGLGFDYVILPVIEHRGLDAIRADDALAAPDGAWLLTRPPQQVVDADPVLAQAAAAALNSGVFENLCVQYVAMTRAKRAMTVLLKPPAKAASDALYFSTHIENALGGQLPWQLGDADWFRAFAAPPEGERPREPQDDGMEGERPREPQDDGMEGERPREPPPPEGEPPPSVRRTIASAAGHEMAAAELFTAADTEATLRGQRVHELLREIEWLDDVCGQGGPHHLDAREQGGLRHLDARGQECPHHLLLAALAAEGLDLTLPSPFRDALRKPAGVLELWRERGFELLDGDEWVSGIFDRVVILETGGQRRIELYDYKSNRPRNRETAAAFAERMAQSYAGQMDTYRRALARLTRIPLANIRATLLLSATLNKLEIKNCRERNCRERRASALHR
ncbi:MAG: UvrD-helicase domain-containing protein [Kiritimatiellaeota bacterium]|nr:UvrD-helicase domain-containing protein [Kiritimatiellota bacterium]